MGGFVKPIYNMKGLNVKAIEYAVDLMKQKKDFTEEDIQTAYLSGYYCNEHLQIGEVGSFGKALESLKHGCLVTRKGWNGKGMFIFMRPADQLPIDFVSKDIKSLPTGVMRYYARDLEYRSGNPDEDVVNFTAYLCMKAADGTIVNGWLASQTDMLSEDWMIFEY